MDSQLGWYCPRCGQSGSLARWLTLEMASPVRWMLATPLFTGLHVTWHSTITSVTARPRLTPAAESLISSLARAQRCIETIRVKACAVARPTIAWADHGQYPDGDRMRYLPRPVGATEAPSSTSGVGSAGLRATSCRQRSLQVNDLDNAQRTLSSGSATALHFLRQRRRDAGQAGPSRALEASR